MSGSLKKCTNFTGRGMGVGPSPLNGARGSLNFLYTQRDNLLVGKTSKISSAFGQAAKTMGV